MNRAALPQMRQQGSGLLLQIGSIAGRFALPYQGLYAASKFALEGLTDSYHYELTPFGIDVAIIEPGVYPTSISANRQVAADVERLALYQTHIDAFMAQAHDSARPTAPPNPQEVADTVAHIIAQPVGERPLRTVVATGVQRQAPQELNAAWAAAVRTFFEAFGLSL